MAADSPCDSNSSNAVEKSEEHTARQQQQAPISSENGLDSSAGRLAYKVVLEKGICGFGIYFTSSKDSAAVVDPAKPFYRLPDDSQAPGEASGVIRAGDRLLAINQTSIEKWAFPEVVEELRRTPLGDVMLRFERTTNSPATNNFTEATATSTAADSTEDGESESSNAARADQQQRRVRWKLFDWQAATTTTAATSKPHEEAMNRNAAVEALLLEMENKIRALEGDVEREKKCRFLSERKNILYRNALRSLSDENAQLRYQVAMGKQTQETTVRFQQQLHLSI